jgi:hypothetical protein
MKKIDILKNQLFDYLDQKARASSGLTLSVVLLTRPKPQTLFLPKGQKGVALVVALIMLLILTILGINAVTTTTFETSIVGNQRIYNTAFYGADGGIEDFRFRSLNNYDILNGITTSFTQEITGSPANITYNVICQRIGGLVERGGNLYQPFRVESEGVAPNFPTAGRVTVESIIEIYAGDQGNVADSGKYN